MIAPKDVLVVAILMAAIAGCSGGDTQPAPKYEIAVFGGDSLSDTVGHVLGTPLAVRVSDLSTGRVVAGLTVSWKVLTGGGGLSAATSITDSSGLTASVLTLGTRSGIQLTQASLAQAQAPAVFVSTALPGPLTGLVKISGDSQIFTTANALPLALVVGTRDQYGNPVPGVPVHWRVAGGGTVSDTEVASDAGGRAATSLTLDSATGVEMVYATTPVLPDTVVFRATAVAPPILAATIPIPPNYGVHDTFIRGGIAMVCIWNSGVRIYDVGNGQAGGTPTNPVLLGSVVPSADNVSAGPSIHNAWWFWNPNGEKKYLFLGQEGPGVVGVSSVGDIHVIDVSDLTHPTEVGFFHLAGVGTHNFWMDEQHQILYAAYYNGGVVSIDVSGTLSGDISSRLISEVKPGGSGNTYTWGVELHNGTLYAVDMLSGLWKLSADSAGHLAVVSGGNNVPKRYSSDLSVDSAAGYVYTGSWDHSQRTGLPGSAVSVWSTSSGTPVLVDTILTTQVGAVSDVKVSPDGKLLMYTTETGNNSGFYFYSLANPAAPTFVSYYGTGYEGIHTGKWAEINGRLYAFGAKNPSNPELIILDVTGLDQ
ncbi:MAG TPA: Ig-like domain-containing protein [Gemmatimonadales bacterium]|jgi:hypothetical protein|nr:Ig-like domain-containing protein [Gemmatimonadales bacterium]